MANDMKEYQNALGNMSGEAVEYIRGVPVVKTFGQTLYSFKRFKQAIDEYEKWTVAYTKNMRVPMTAFTTSANGIFAALIIAAYAFTRHGITDKFIINLLFYIIITSVITVTLMKVAYAGESKMLVDDALNRVNNIMNIKPMSETSDEKTPKDASVEIDNVEFSYDNNSSRKAIDGISLKIEAGSHIALVGPSGGGKTTLGSLIARFYDPEKGTVKIGGVDVKDISSRHLMEQVSYVFQDSHLLKMSILENVRMGKPDATDYEVMEALEKAQCMDIIAKFPDGINTIIGSKGVFVSGGEAQRLSIARAFLKDAPVLILDEATAFADPDNECKVQQAFENLAKNKTVIMIAHRLSTITSADCIYVLEKGKIAEAGTYNELMEKHGIFCHMWNEYNKSANWKVGKEGILS